MRRGTRGAGALAFAIVVSAFACRQLVGIEDDPPTDIAASNPDAGDAGNACGLTSRGGCGACVERACCAEATACAAIPSCASYAACLDACAGDAFCRATCTSDRRIGAQQIEELKEVTALRVCLAKSCETDCNLSCGAVADYLAPPSAANACQSCLERTACGIARTCATDPGCGAYYACHLSAPTGDVGQECLDRFVDGGRASSFARIETTCEAACAYGRDWSCLGRVAWPPSAATSTAFTLQFITAGKVVKGASVAICKNPECTDVAATGVTSPLDGFVSLDVPLDPNGLGPGVNEFVLLRATDGGDDTTYDHRIYWGFPFSRKLFSFGYAASSRADIAALLQAVGQTQIPGRGHVYAFVQDCRLRQAPHAVVKVSGDDASKTFYFDNGNPSPTASETFASGNAAVSNVREGYVDVTASALDLDGGVTSKHVVYVHADALTVITLAPTP